jgi:hypothetical protein
MSGVILILAYCLTIRSFYSPFNMSSHMSSSARICLSGLGSGHSSEFTSSESGSGGSITSKFGAVSSLYASSSRSSSYCLLFSSSTLLLAKPLNMPMLKPPDFLGESLRSRLLLMSTYCSGCSTSGIFSFDPS